MSLFPKFRDCPGFLSGDRTDAGGSQKAQGPENNDCLWVLASTLSSTLSTLSVLSYSLSHVNRSLGLFKEATQGPALDPQSPWKQVPLLPLLRLPLFRTRGSLACCSEAILSLLIFRLFSLSLLSALKLDFERSGLSLVQNPQIPKTMLSIPVRSS